MNGTVSRPANTRSEKQIELTNRLIAELREYDEKSADAVRDDLRTKWRTNEATFRYCYDTNSMMIAVLKGHRRERNAAHRSAGRPVVDPGRYAFDDGDNEVRFYLVEFDKKAGRYTVSVQAGPDFHPLPWPTALAVLREIEVDPKAAAITYGLHKKVCGRCNTPLTKKSSREAGIGPICATRF